MSGYWRVWCPVCCRLRQSKIPANAPTTVVAVEYDTHMQRKHKERT